MHNKQNNAQNYQNGQQYHHDMVDEGTNMDEYEDHRGSSGFVQNVGFSQQSQQNQLNNSMKDSPYDAYDGNYSRIYKKYNHK